MVNNTFYIKSGATLPKLVVTLADDAGIALTLSGTVIMAVKSRFGSVIEFAATILDQNDPDTIGQIEVARLGVNPDTDAPMTPDDYNVEYRYTDDNDNLYIFPTVKSEYDDPLVDRLVVQKALD